MRVVVRMHVNSSDGLGLDVLFRVSCVVSATTIHCNQHLRSYLVLEIYVYNLTVRYRYTHECHSYVFAIQFFLEASAADVRAGGLELPLQLAEFCSVTLDVPNVSAPIDHC